MTWKEIVKARPVDALILGAVYRQKNAFYLHLNFSPKLEAFCDQNFLSVEIGFDEHFGKIRIQSNSKLTIRYKHKTVFRGSRFQLRIPIPVYFPKQTQKSQPLQADFDPNKKSIIVTIPAEWREGGLPQFAKLTDVARSARRRMVS